MTATGTFEVKLAPVDNDSTPEGPNLGRMSMDKTFEGDFDGVSKGEMITAAGIAVKESAAYSAVERMTGTLHGKKGSFALQHTGIMDRGKPSLVITVVPDSGTADLGDIVVGRRDSVSRATARHIARCAMRRRTHDCRFCDRSHPLPPQLVDIKVFNHWARALRPWPGWRGLHSLINRADPSRAPCTNWCATTSRRSARRRRTCATDTDCRASSNKSFATS